MRRRRHVRDPRARGEPGQVLAHVRPRLAAVARDLKIAVVGAHPDHVRVLGRLADGVHRAVVLGGRVVHRQATGLLLLQLQRIVRGQVGRDLLPRVAHVARAIQVLRAHVERAARAHVHRRVPVEAQLGVAGAAQRLDVSWSRRWTAVRARRARPGTRSRRRLDPWDRGTPRSRRRQQAVPQAIRHAARARAGRGPRAVVLQTAVHVVRNVHVVADVIELPDRDVLARPPRVAAVERQVHAAVGADDDELGVLGIDPHRVQVAVVRRAAVAAARHAGERLAAVLADREVQATFVDTVEQLGVRRPCSRNRTAATSRRRSSRCPSPSARRCRRSSRAKSSSPRRPRTRGWRAWAPPRRRCGPGRRPAGRW